MPTNPPEDQVKVRILTACFFGKANDVVTLPAADAEDAVSAGLADANPAAVSYAESL